MPYAKVYVDGFLLNWGDSLFYEPYQRPKQRQSAPSGWLASMVPGKPSKIREQISRTTDKVPEVMVKITSRQGAGKGMRAIRSHLEYISRNNKIELEDQDGHVIGARSELEKLEDFWQMSGGRSGWPIKEESKYKEAFNVMFSMPAGTPAEKVKDAAKEFFKEEFEGRSHVFALHTDTFKPHVHMCILAEPDQPGLKRLHPMKKDLQQWREGFAKALRDQGIEANATSRSTRGQTRFPIPQDRLHRAIRLQQPISWPSADLKELRASYKLQHEAWKKVSGVLAKSENEEDRNIGESIYKFWADAPINQLPIAAHQQEREKTNGREEPDGREETFLYQPKLKTNRRETPAEGIAHLRSLSGIGMVHNLKHFEKLSHHDARDHLERKR